MLLYENFHSEFVDIRIQYPVLYLFIFFVLPTFPQLKMLQSTSVELCRICKTQQDRVDLIIFDRDEKDSYTIV